MDPRFPARVQAAVEPFGGVVTFIALAVSPEEQERRIVQPSRAAFGKLQSVDLLRRLRADLDAWMKGQGDEGLSTERSLPDPRAKTETSK